ncbi:MAG: 50S ribosomal protein L23 [Candidatus Omnitrophica bacterium]|nr:50S ribosomal protein L23 [Candidatus Omnitrophota bacterium]
MRAATEIVRRVLQTEKGSRIAKADQYLLEVAPDSNKVEIRQAVEELFNVKVQQVNTQLLHGKWRRLSNRWGQRSDRKRAFVTLEKGQKIEVKS